MPHRVFTVEKVNSLIPEMERVLAELEAQREEMEQLEVKLNVLDAIWGIRVYMADNPDHKEAHQYRNALDTAKYAMEYTIYRELSFRGIRFPPGGLENGLLDFLSCWEGRWVYLCWQRGEPEVQAWHELDGGFAGRQPITPEQVQRMGKKPRPAFRDAPTPPDAEE